MLGHSTETVCAASLFELEGMGLQVYPGGGFPSSLAGRYSTGVISPSSAGGVRKLYDFEDVRVQEATYHCKSR